MDENNAISVIENLIETCKDGQKGYQDAAAHVKRSDLKTFFNEESLERARFAGELEAELIRLGKPDKKVSGSVGGSLRRAWIETKVSLGGGERRFWNRLRPVRTLPRKATRRRSLAIYRRISLRLFAGKRPVSRELMTR